MNNNLNDRMVTRSVGAFFVIWGLSAIASLAGMGLVIYVVWHFVSKFW
jgi:hypothetical protein